MSGGGSKGAYEMGALTEMIAILPPDQVKYNVISGVSAGSLNAAYLSTFEIGKEKEMADYMLALYNDMTTDQIWKFWPGGIEEGVFKESGLFDNSPMLSNITGTLNAAGTIKRKLVVSATDT
jgi:predicted acylesterase/phospholipase RssA